MKAKHLWRLRFIAYEWCADPVIKSPLWGEKINLWLGSDGQVQLASGCCAVQLSLQQANRLQPSSWACIACDTARPQARLRASRLEVPVTDTLRLREALVEWIEPIGDSSYTDLIAGEVSETLLVAWTEKLEACYCQVESREEEKEAWKNLKEVAEAIKAKSPTRVNHG